jgi:hypothetical protein
MNLLDSTLGLDFINDHIIELANYLVNFTSGNMSQMVGIARTLGIIFAMIVIAVECYKVMAKGQGFDLMAMARPILFAFVLSSWPAVCSTLTYPGGKVEEFFKEKFEVEKEQIVQLRNLRQEAAMGLSEALREKKAAAEQLAKQTETDKGLVGEALEAIGNATEQIIEWGKSIQLTTESFFKNLIESAIIWLGELYWQCSVYFIFLIKSIYIAVLTIFGPITMACSILPIWKDAWSQWVGRMVSVSLYGAMAYLVMIFSMQLMKYGVQADTQIINNILAGEDSLQAYQATGLGSTLQTLIGLICGGMALKTVPEIASWVVPSAAVHSANGFMAGTAGKIQSTATNLATKGVSKGL